MPDSPRTNTSDSPVSISRIPYPILEAAESLRRQPDQRPAVPQPGEESGEVDGDDDAGLVKNMLRTGVSGSYGVAGSEGGEYTCGARGVEKDTAREPDDSSGREAVSELHLLCVVVVVELRDLPIDERLGRAAVAETAKLSTVPTVSERTRAIRGRCGRCVWRLEGKDENGSVNSGAEAPLSLRA